MEDRGFTISNILSILKRRKKSLFIPALLVLLIAGTIILVLPPIYDSTSTILIEGQEIPASFVMATVTTFVEQRLQTINQRIMSFTRLLDIINRFNLYQDMREKHTTEEIVQKMREDINFKTISADVIDPRTGRPATATIAFTVSYEGKNPQLVYQVANVLTSLYLEENVQTRERQSLETSLFLKGEMKNVKSQLTDIDGRLAKFKEQHINELPELLQINLNSLDRMDLNIEQLNSQLRNLQEREGYLQAQLAGIPRQNEDQDRLDQLRVQLNFLKSRFTDQYPEVIKTKTEIAELEKRLSDSNQKNESSKVPLTQGDNPAYVALASQLASTRTDIASLKKQMQNVKQQKNEFQRRVETTPKVEAEYRALTTERENTLAKYNDLMRKFMEAKVSQGLEKEQKGERFTLIDPARVPEKPTKPNRLVILLIGLILAIGAGIGFASIMEFTDTSILDERDLSHKTSFPVLGCIPVFITGLELMQEKRRRKRLLVGIALAMVVGLLIFHFFVMDLGVFWVRLMRRLAF
ncbi:MAG: Wzz/FepE/Etk N-terminal domain-containing protein [Thermodesulfobacteriota bacterium]|jgi:polysaccharide chain length determinant protein (PEP-CTERM system associated)|nr:MAG: Wzz/FepE/Etk N-terminal domain-containing protein [Thermodesulfobacteriota bacterium]